MIHEKEPNPTPQGVMLSIVCCQATRADGEACRAPTGDSGYCFWHDPERREEMLEASRTGGSRKTLPISVDRPLEAKEARGILASVLGALLQGAVDPTTARAAAYILQVERKIAEGEELEQRLAALEAAVHGRMALPEPVFDAEYHAANFSDDEEAADE